MAEWLPEMKANQANWNDRVAVHLGPNGYDVAGLGADPTRLSGTVTIDAPRLGSLTGLRVAHLQCHMGMDTLSLTRLGATCVGLDFSADAIRVARALATETSAQELSYTGEGALANTRTYEWNHSVAEIIQAMIEAGLTITEVADENILEWEFYEGQPKVSPGQWGLPPELAMRIPLMLRVQATKN
jgi:hypothetical protein